MIGAPHPRHERFSRRVENYVRHRPGYPSAVLEKLREGRALRSGDRVCDVGAGTGILSAMFLDAGHEVVAIEPNARMRAAAVEWLGDRDGFGTIAASAEATTLPDAAVDLVVAGQAFHWFDRAGACAEFARILKPGGMLALVWNLRHRGGTRFLDGYEQLLRRHGIDYLEVQARVPDDDAVRALFDLESFRQHLLPSAQRLDREALRGRMLSASYLPGRGDSGFDALLAGIEQLFDATCDDGEVVITYDTRLSFGRLIG